jgi:hypothetical protein
VNPGTPSRHTKGGPFSEILKERAGEFRRPPRVVTLPLACWADEHPDRPAAPIEMGLRVASDEDFQRAQDEAAKAVVTFASAGDGDDKVRAYNDALITEIVAACTCQATNVQMPFFEMAALDVRRRLTPAGIKRLWEELQILEATAQPALSTVTEEGLGHLYAMLDRGVAWEYLPREEELRLKRLLEHVRLNLAVAEELAERDGVALVVGLEPEAREPATQEVSAAAAALDRMTHPSR